MDDRAPSDHIPSDTAIEIIGLLEKSDEKLDQAGRLSATSAFNLGCTVGLIPVIIVILITLFATRFLWLATITVAVLMMIALVGFANLVALISRSKAMERVYRTEISPVIEQLITENDITEAQFYQYAAETLPTNSNLREFMPLPKPPEISTPKRFRFKFKP